MKTHERDLALIAALYSEISEITESMGMQTQFGRHLKVCYLMPHQGKEMDKIEHDEVSIAKALQLNEDEMYARCNAVIADMLKERLQAKRQELKKLGIWLSDEPPPEKRKKKEPLRLVDHTKSNGAAKQQSG